MVFSRTNRHNPPSDLDEEDEIGRDARLAKNYQLAIISAGCIGVGLLLYLVFHTITDRTTYFGTIRPSGGSSTVKLSSTSGHSVGDALLDGLPDLGLALISVGLVGVIYEVFNRRASDRLYAATIRITTRNLAERIGERLTRAALSEPDFVQNVLDDTQRQTLLSALIGANIGSTDESAEMLARALADGLAGSTKLRQFQVDYTVQRDSTEDSALYYAEYRQRFQSNERPSRIFKYHFEVVESLDGGIQTADQMNSDVFYWRYWRDPTEERDAEQILEAFDFIDGKVNAVMLTPARREDLEKELAPNGRPWSQFLDPTPGEKWLFYIYDDDSEPSTFYFDTRLKIPVSKIGALFYVQPRKLALNMKVKCNYPVDAFRVAPVDALGTDNVSIEPYSGHTIVSTPDWVSPTATVGFALYPVGKVIKPAPQSGPSPATEAEQQSAGATVATGESGPAMDEETNSIKTEG